MQLERQNHVIFPKKLQEKKQLYSMREWVPTYWRSQSSGGDGSDNQQVKLAYNGWQSIRIQEKRFLWNQSLNHRIHVSNNAFRGPTRSSNLSFSPRKLRRERYVGQDGKGQELEVRIWGQIYCKKNASTKFACGDIIYNCCGSSQMHGDCRANSGHWGVQVVARSS